MHGSSQIRISTENVDKRNSQMQWRKNILYTSCIHDVLYCC